MLVETELEFVSAKLCTECSGLGYITMPVKINFTRWSIGKFACPMCHWHGYLTLDKPD